MLKSPTLIIGALGLVVAIAWFAFGGWLSGVKTVPVAAVSTVPASPSLPSVPASQPVAGVPVMAVHPIRIQGGMTTTQGGETVWLWVSDEGRLMTEDEIAGESGGTVSSRLVRGVRVLSGTGVRYGGTRSEQAFVQNQIPSSPVESPARESAVNTAAAEPPLASGPGRPDLLASPPGLLASPPDLR